ncbi:Mfa1 family fimbria major subunit [Parabacteroides sp. W1-Q-101]|uniref:Mfa1 family fimbria major subunit n=1 Tax=Parabacteroides TaxID=375288 RepID=UPI00203007B1|nr:MULTISPECIES: Mfa1 family fimbria major subunit [Parabacteroides]MCM0719574.1 Mfa1 family fimbria major subunit [Parabacteroides sp. W1-Q-101]
MKKKNFLMFALASFMFAACSESLPDGGEDGGGNSSAGGDAWVSLNVVTTTTTKALHDPDQENGTADESKVNTMMALFFDSHLTGSNNPALLTKLSWGTGDPEIGTPGQPGGTPTKAFKVDKNSKAFMIILNPSSDFTTNVASASTFDDVNKIIANTSVGAVIGGTNQNSFMMTNAKGKLEPTTITDAGSSVTVTDNDLVTYATAGEAEGKPYKVTVDRVAAKVRLFADNNYPQSTLDINTVGWTLNVTNKKYYPMSERTETWLETTARGCITPFDKWHFGSYRVDPNYDGQKTSMANITTTPYTDNYAYYTHASAPSWVTATADSTGPNASKIPALYCLENTQEENDNYQAYTTHVLLKVVSQPKGLQLPNNGGTYNGTTNSDNDVDASGKVNPGSAWIKIGTDGYYSYKLVVKYIEAELTAKYTDQAPDDYLQTSVTNAFGAYLDSLVKYSVPNVTAITLPTAAAFQAKLDDNTYSSIADGAQKIAASFEQAGVKTHGAAAYGNVSYYEGGEGYHVIMIKHDNDTDNTNNKLGEFGVVRNSVYDIAIKDIKTPGYPIIPEPDPGKKDEEEESFISVEIGINPWTWYRQEIEL